MLTWMDAFVKNAADWGEVFGKRQGKSFSTDLEATKWFLAGIQKSIPTLEKRKSELASTPRFVNLTSVMPFAFPLLFSEPNKLLCLQIGDELSADFFGAKPPETDEYLELLEKHSAIYIDLEPDPNNSRDTLDLRCIFIKKIHDVHGRIATDFEGAVDAMVNGDYSYLEGVERRIAVCGILGPKASRFNFEEIIPVSFFWGANMTIYGQPIDDPDAQATAKEIQDLVKLCLLYHLSGEGPRVALPTVSDDELALTRKRKKQHAKHLSRSLFRVVRLNSPPERFGRLEEERGQREGYSLQVRVRVRGHFRWQPHGEGRKLRRLQWISAYEKGPSDGRQLIDLYRMAAKKRPEKYDS